MADLRETLIEAIAEREWRWYWDHNGGVGAVEWSEVERLRLNDDAAAVAMTGPLYSDVESIAQQLHDAGERKAAKQVRMVLAQIRVAQRVASEFDQMVAELAAERERAARFEAQLAASQEEARGLAHTLDKAMSELCDARAENERLNEHMERQRKHYVLVEAELAAERAKVAAGIETEKSSNATCDVFGDEYYALRQSIRAALAGGQGE